MDKNILDLQRDLVVVRFIHIEVVQYGKTELQRDVVANLEYVPQPMFIQSIVFL